MDIKRFCHRHQQGLRRHVPDGERAGGGGRASADGDPLGDTEPTSRPADEELEIEKKWLLLARTDGEQFSWFFEKYRRPVLSYIQRRVGDPDVADDLLSETFLQAVDGLWRFRFQGVTFGAWLFRLAQRRVARYYEAQERQHRLSLALESGDPAVDPAIEAGLEAEQDAQLLAYCLGQLDGIAQDIIVLYYWEDLSLSQIAVILDDSEVNVKSRMYRARRKLASLLGSTAVRAKLSREGRRALDDLRRELGRLSVVSGRDERGRP